MRSRTCFTLTALLVSTTVGLTALALPAEAASKPSISSLSPTTGGLFGGAKVKISGKYFTKSSTVAFGDQAAAVTYSSSKTLYAVSPASENPGKVAVTVTTSKGTSKAKSFEYRVPPSITSLSDSSGLTTEAKKITVTGVSFLKDSTDVTFGGVEATKVTYKSSTELQVTVPKRSEAGTVDVVASNKYGTGSPARYTYETPPPSSDLKVGSFNVRNNRLSSTDPTNSREKSWKTRLPVVVDQIERSGLDVVGIQEASAGNNEYNKYGSSQFDDLVTDLGDPYRLTNEIEYCDEPDSAGRCDGETEGSSSDRIIYDSNRLALLSQGARKLDGRGRTDGKGRYVAWARFTDLNTGRQFFFATTHLEPGDSASTRKRQAGLILDEIDYQNTGDLPVVLVGDLGAGKFDKYTSGGVHNVGHETLIDGGFADPLVNSYKYKGEPRVAEAKNEQYSSLNYFASKPQQLSGYPIGSYLDYILTQENGTDIDWNRWETVLDLQSDGDFDGTIPSDHNLVTLSLTLG